MIPPRTILAAVDFSEPSRVALVFAARLATHCQARLHVVHAEDPLLGAAARTAGIDLAGETREELQRFIETAPPARDRAPDTHVVVGVPADVICHIADREQADLIVIGTHGMSGAAQLFFGSVAEAVLVRANVSVLAVPEAWMPPRPDRADLTGMGPIVAGIECTTPALAAAAAACRLAAVLGATVDAAHVVAPIQVPERWSAHAAEAARERIDTARRDLALLLPQLRSEVPVHLHVESGRIAERLAATATATRAHRPLLVLGRRPPGARRGPPGAIAARVLALAKIPVLVYLPEE
jgi:nucleotide-binding universal stress UspA family protein